MIHTLNIKTSHSSSPGRRGERVKYQSLSVSQVIYYCLVSTSVTNCAVENLFVVNRIELIFSTWTLHSHLLCHFLQSHQRADHEQKYDISWCWDTQTWTYQTIITEHYERMSQFVRVIFWVNDLLNNNSSIAHGPVTSVHADGVSRIEQRPRPVMMRKLKPAGQEHKDRSQDDGAH